MIHFMLNGEPVSTDVPEDTPLLWVIRDYFNLKGSKFGCGMGLCGACSMQLDGVSTRTCILPVSAVEGRHVTTIEGLGTADNLHPLQKAWVKHSVPQCGYCQSGQLISASALLAQNPNPTEDDIANAMSGNLCRCGTYPRIKDAILDTAAGGVAQWEPPGSDNAPSADSVSDGVAQEKSVAGGEA
ncbi:(2Fe-2S)-binding protein [Marinibactrum halimedae]|uniref:Oxidoreductase n=1 Tax=Marinibactrum halimedae TaxID=1444977 RepID=A0AA37T4A8_9GAMM|nr:(2Fe-2S)-binding protein [Marinibactrum halimedae]MCD9458734.1 (2Fe-2S)-binding protein [Marinibactrum halimedae]GLS25291.1 oxidoreductase [Marinibactrum halimedae]